MNRVLIATSVGMTLLLAGCGSGGSGAAGNSLSPAVDADSTTSTPVQPDTGAAGSSASGTSSTTSEAPTSAAKPSTGTSSSAKPSAKPPVQPSIHPSAGDKPVALCTVGQLRIVVAGGNSDMQGAHRSLRFTNVSNTVCKLTGAPGVSYVAGSDGHQVGKPAQRIVGHQPTVLIPNATASAGLFISSAPRKSDCAKADARGIRVYPPDSYQAAFVPLAEVTCSSAASGPYLKVGPILPGANNTV